MGVGSDLTILDLTQNLPGPFCTMLFAYLGANVIKVEPPGGDPARSGQPQVDGMSIAHHQLGVNKQSICLNLKLPAARAAFLRLAAKADVVIEGFRPGVVDRLGVGYQDVSSVNPRIIYCSLSGYGQDGPYRDLPGHDLNYIGFAGLLGMTGTRSGELAIPGVQVADVAGGALMAAFGIAFALYHRAITGEGQYLDVAMLDGSLALAGIHAAAHLATGEPSPPGAMPLTGAHPCYGLYQASDGRPLAVGALERPFWAEICRTLGLPDCIDKQFATGAEGEAAKARLAAVFATRTSSEWFQLLGHACVSPVLSFAETMTNPQILSRRMVTSVPAGVDSVRLVNFPIRFSHRPVQLQRPAPRLGEHGREILMAAGYTPAEVDLLVQEGALVACE